MWRSSTVYKADDHPDAQPIATMHLMYILSAGASSDTRKRWRSKKVGFHDTEDSTELKVISYDR